MYNQRKAYMNSRDILSGENFGAPCLVKPMFLFYYCSKFEDINSNIYDRAEKGDHVRHEAEDNITYHTSIILDTDIFKHLSLQYYMPE